MKIREIRAVGLRGATPEGGWTEEIKPEDCVPARQGEAMSEKYTTDELVEGLCLYRDAGIDMSDGECNAIIAKLRKADKLCEAAKDIELLGINSFRLRKAIADYEEGK